MRQQPSDDKIATSIDQLDMARSDFNRSLEYLKS